MRPAIPHNDRLPAVRPPTLPARTLRSSGGLGPFGPIVHRHTDPDREDATVRVAVVNHHPHDVTGGSELQCDLVARGLSGRGHDVVYVAVGHAPGADAGGGTVDLPYALVPAAQDPRSLADAVLATAPDVVYWRFNRRGLREVARLLSGAGVPLVVALAHVDDVTPWPSWPWPGPGSTLRDRASDLRSRLRWRRQLAAYRDVAAIASQREDLLGAVPYRTVALQRHIPNMMDPTLADAPAFHHPRPFVAWVANLKPRKRPELLPALADALAPHGVDVLVAGTLQDERYAWLTQPDPSRPNLRYLGALPTPEVVSLLAAARCLAVTAMPEGFSNVMLQAWWSGTPTVSLDYDPDGLVRRESLGSVADGDLGRFHAEVTRLATVEEGRASDAHRTASFARTMFEPDAILAAVEELLVDARTITSMRRASHH
jgi:glycosyltransferase involved in cell wall biosynthesis